MSFFMLLVGRFFFIVPLVFFSLRFGVFSAGSFFSGEPLIGTPNILRCTDIRLRLHLPRPVCCVLQYQWIGVSFCNGLLLWVADLLCLQRASRSTHNATADCAANLHIWFAYFRCCCCCCCC